MPHNVNGIGTTYYGASDRQPDGSFVTTEWFILFSVPLIPLRSVRVRYRGESSRRGSTTKHYDIIDKAPLDSKHVLHAYAWALIPLALAFLIFVVGMALPSSSARSTATTVCAGSLILGIGFWVIVFPSIYKAQ
jgi:lipopolysaccharide export LptBFGC system permease protein LptF